MTHPFNVEWLEETPSTSALLLERVGSGDFHHTVIAAHRQTAGKGRRGRTWFTAEGNIACSIGFVFGADEKDRVATAPLLVGICAYDAVNSILDPQCKQKLTIKWPNDLVYDQQKLMGVLSQSRIQNGKLYLSIGIGLNVCWAPEGLPAISLQDLPLRADCPTNHEFLEILLNSMKSHLATWNDYTRLKELWEDRVTYLGKEIRFGLLEEEANMQSAKAIGLDKNGSLIVEFADGQKEALLTQDLSLRL